MRSHWIFRTDRAELRTQGSWVICSDEEKADPLNKKKEKLVKPVEDLTNEKQAEEEKIQSKAVRVLPRSRTS